MPVEWNKLGTLIGVLCLLAGCIPEQRAQGPDELPLKPLRETGEFSALAGTGRQGASLQLTMEGRDYLRAARFEEAMSKFQEAISIFSFNPYAYFYFGEARYLRKEYDQSLPLLEKAELFLSNDPIWLARVYVLRGKNYEALLRYEEANRSYRQAVSEDPRNLEAREGMDRLRQLQERH